MSIVCVAGRIGCRRRFTNLNDFGINVFELTVRIVTVGLLKIGTELARFEISLAIYCGVPYPRTSAIRVDQSCKAAQGVVSVSRRLILVVFESSEFRKTGER